MECQISVLIRIFFNYSLSPCFPVKTVLHSLTDIGGIRFSIYTQTLLSLNDNKLRSFSDFVEECTEKAKIKCQSTLLERQNKLKEGD